MNFSKYLWMLGTVFRSIQWNCNALKNVNCWQSSATFWRNLNVHMFQWFCKRIGNWNFLLDYVYRSIISVLERYASIFGGLLGTSTSKLKWHRLQLHVAAVVCDKRKWTIIEYLFIGPLIYSLLRHHCYISHLTVSFNSQWSVFLFLLEFKLIQCWHKRLTSNSYDTYDK